MNFLMNVFLIIFMLMGFILKKIITISLWIVKTDIYGSVAMGVLYIFRQQSFPCCKKEPTFQTRMRRSRMMGPGD